MTRFIRIPDVIKKTGLAKSTIWLWVKEGKFPKPIKLSPRVTVWEEEKIELWIKTKL
ncbi:AlpA family phage regulatory protein [Halarcobacter sp.]|uniref:helix-turn-helix transcriptional regulator n=1 Tax=Halarcobacter sp. TaxID=2321133 RepID=UPI002AA7ECCA|nr:AlpA family phage regulatory protein [Halarcobacter sp.]